MSWMTFLLESIQIMSSGKCVSFIQKHSTAGFENTKIMPWSCGKDTRFPKPRVRCAGVLATSSENLWPLTVNVLLTSKLRFGRPSINAASKQTVRAASAIRKYLILSFRLTFESFLPTSRFYQTFIPIIYLYIYDYVMPIGTEINQNSSQTLLLSPKFSSPSENCGRHRRRNRRYVKDGWHSLQPARWVLGRN
jgi:hypothetical protein